MVFFQLEETFGILVTGGLDAEGNVLDTAEFLDLKVRLFRSKTYFRLCSMLSWHICPFLFKDKEMDSDFFTQIWAHWACDVPGVRNPNHNWRHQRRRFLVQHRAVWQIFSFMECSASGTRGRLSYDKVGKIGLPKKDIGRLVKTIGSLGLYARELHFNHRQWT